MTALLWRALTALNVSRGARPAQMPRTPRDRGPQLFLESPCDPYRWSAGATYFNTVRSMSSDPKVLAAVDKAEREFQRRHASCSAQVHTLPCEHVTLTETPK